MMTVTGDSTDVTTYFALRLAADGTDATGLTVTNFDLQYVRSGATPAAKVDASALAGTNSAHADNSAIEIDATDQPGLYRVDWPDAAFASGVREVILTVKCATCFTEHLRVQIDAPVNATKWGGTAVGSTEVRANLINVAGSAVNTSSAQLGVNVVNAAGTAWGSGAITAAAIANGAIDAATFAADVDAEILSYLVDDATRIDASALNTATGTSIPAILEDTGTTLQGELDGIQADTEDIQGRLPAALTGDGFIKADTLKIEGADPTDTINAQADLALADYDPPTRAEATADKNEIIAYLAGLVIAKGTIGATGNSTTALHLTGLTYGDDEINNYLLAVKDVSTGEWHARYIEDWADTGDLATVATLPFTPENSVDLYVLLAFRQDVTGGAGLDAAGVRAAVGLASANLDTQLADIEGKVDDVETRMGTPSDLGGGATLAANLVVIEGQTDDIGTAGAGLTAIPWNSAWDAEVESEVTDSLVAHNLDHLMKTATAGADMTSEVPDNTVLARILSNGDTSVFDPSTDGLQLIRDKLTDIETDTAEIGAAGAGLTNINLPNQTMDIVGNITGSLSGSVGSVTGNVGGNVAGSVGSVTATVSADVVSISGDSAAADNAEAFFDGTGFGAVLQRTTIASLSSQTSFTLTAGSADDDAYNYCEIVVQDSSTAAQKAVGVIADYTGSSRTVTLQADPAVFTMATGDVVTILASRSLKPTVNNRHLDISSGGEAGVDWANVGTPGSSVNLSATTVNLVNTLTTYTGNTPQTGDSYAIVNSGTHGNAAIKGYVDDIGTAGAGLTAVPWNAAWDAEVQSEVEDGLNNLGYTTTVSGRIDAAISSRSTVTTAQVNAEVDTALADVGLTTTITGRIDVAVSTRLASSSYTAPLSASQTQTECEEALQTYHLDHLLASADPGGVVANSSFWAALTSKSATPAYASYSNQTDSLEALRDRGDAAWVTATGFSTHSAADVWAAGTRTLTAGTNIVLAKGTGVTGFTDLDAAGVRTAVGLASANLDTQLGDLPTATENADALLARNVSNVEGSAGEHTLCTVILATLESSVSGTTWTIRKTGGTTHATKTVTVDDTADPITGVT